MRARTTLTAFVLLAAGAAHAAPIVVSNASFEDPQTTMGNFLSITPPGWSIHDPGGIVSAGTDFGVWWPGFFDFPNGAPDGVQIGVAYLDLPPGTGEAGLRQSLAATLHPNTRYTLDAFVGDPTDNAGAELAGFPGYRVELSAGGHLVGSDDDTAMQEGQLRPVRVTLPVGSVHPGMGEALEIRLINRNATAGAEVDFDAITLDATPGAIETYAFRAAHAGGAVAGVLVYDRERSAATQNFGRDASIAITEATGDLAAFGGFDWDVGFVNAAGTVLMLSEGTGTGNFLLLLFGQSLNLNAPLPFATLQPASSSVYLASQPVIGAGESGASFTIPEAGATGTLTALVALIALRRVRKGD